MGEVSFSKTMELFHGMTGLKDLDHGRIADSTIRSVQLFQPPHIVVATQPTGAAELAPIVNTMTMTLIGDSSLTCIMTG